MNTKDYLVYCWKHKMCNEIVTTEGKSVEVTDQGLFDRNNGRSFFNAKVRIDNTLYVGNVLVLVRSSDWYLNGFDLKDEFCNIILVICEAPDSELFNSKGEHVNVSKVTIPENVLNNFGILTDPKIGQLVCKGNIIKYNSTLVRHAWFAAMQTEFLEEKSDAIKHIQCENGDVYWDSTAFISLFGSFGFGRNDDNMIKLAKSIPLRIIDHYKDDLFQIEALIFGQAGLLELNCIPSQYQERALSEGYFAKLRNEYIYLAHKHSLKPIRVDWNKFGPGQQQFPHVVLSMLANLYYSRDLSTKSILDIKSVDDCYHVFNTHPTPYWHLHYNFGAETKKSEKIISHDKKSYVIASFFVPFIFAYGRAKSDEVLCDRAFDIMEQMKVFSTQETKLFTRAGIIPNDAGECIAQIQLQRNYCDEHDCINCRFGFNFVKNHQS